MCSPGGNATLNSFMKLDTFLFDMTVHSHSLTLRIESETFTLRLPFTLVWHPRRQCSFISLREKWPFSVSRISPPPSRTCRRHCPQLPLPPQADERCMPLSLSVESSEPPCSTSNFLSPLTVIVTFPLGLRYFLAISSIATKTSMMTRNTAMLTPINCPIVLLFLYSLFVLYCSFFCCCQNCSPLKHIIAIAMRPTVMKAIPMPWRGLGMSLYSIFSRMAPNMTMASVQPSPLPMA